VAAVRVPDGGGAGVAFGGVRDGRAPHAADVVPDAHRGQRQRRAAPAGARPTRPGELRHRAPRVPDDRRARLPPDAAGQQPGVPGAARGVGGGHARRGGVAGALPGAAAAARERAVPGVAIQAAHRGEGAAPQPETAVQASVTARSSAPVETRGKSVFGLGLILMYPAVLELQICTVIDLRPCKVKCKWLALSHRNVVLRVIRASPRVPKISS
jgi:hypothetical protein